MNLTNVYDDQPQTCTYNTVREKSIPNLISIFFPLNRLGLCGIHLIDFSTFRCGFVNTSNFEITHHQGGVQGFTSIQEKSGAFSPQPRKTTKISATTSEEGTWKSLKYWPPDGSTYARACYETQTVAGPSIHIFHTVIFAFILKHLKTKFCRFTVAWNFPIVTGLYFNFTNFQSKEVGGNFYLCL